MLVEFDCVAFVVVSQRTSSCRLLSSGVPFAGGCRGSRLFISGPMSEKWSNLHGKRSAQHRHQWSSTNQLSRFHRNQSPLILHGTHTTTHSPQCPLTFSFPFPHFSPLPFTSRTVLKSTHRPSQCHSCPLTHHNSSANCLDSSTSTSTN